MDFELSAEQQRLCADIYDASREQFGTPRDGPHFTRKEWQAAGALGLLGLCLPEEYGGEGLGALDTALGLESFGRGCRDMGLVFGVSAHLLACGVPIRDFGTREAREEFLPGMCAGELVAANAMTEENAGSDSGSLATAAIPQDGGYVVSGEKTFASNAPVADIIVTYGVTSPDAGFLGITGFAIPAVPPGVWLSEPFAKMGLTGCPGGRVRFEECWVPERYRLGSEGQGAAIFQHSMSWERSCLFAGYLGLMERQLDRCVVHARERQQFGRRIGEFQAVSHRITLMKQRLESARLLLYRACWLVDQGRQDATASALSKIAVSEAAVANGIDAIQIFGGRGYLEDCGIEENLRDSIPGTLFSGTNEIQRELIAREAGL